MKTIWLALTTLLVLVPAAPAQTRRREPPPPADALSVDSIVSALYASVSHAPDASPDFERMRSIFLYVGMLVPPIRHGEEITGRDIDAFAESYKNDPARQKEGAKGFSEHEIARRTDCFGNVCQVFSTYESRHTESDAKPFERGINAIQLVRDGHRWWIASVAWDFERDGNEIPAQYLPGSKP